MGRGAVLSLVAVAAGCYDFGRFQFRDGGAPDAAALDGAAPDAAALDGASPDAAAVDLATGDLAGPCVDPAGVNLLTNTDSEFDLGHGDWQLLYGSWSIAGAPAGCFYPKALSLCATTVNNAGGMFGQMALDIPSAVDPTKTYVATLWIALANTQLGAQLIVRAIDANGSPLMPMNSVTAMQTTGWQILTTGVTPPAGAKALQLLVTVGNAKAMMPNPGDCLSLDRAWLVIQ